MTTPTTRVLPVVVASATATGALIGGTVAAIKGAVRVSEGKMTKAEAVKAVATESAGTGLATAAGVAATGLLGLGGLVGILGFTVVATGAKMAWDKAVPSFCIDDKVEKIPCCEIE